MQRKIERALRWHSSGRGGGGGGGGAGGDRRGWEQNGWEVGVTTKGTPGRLQGRRMSPEEQQGEGWRRQLLGVRRGREGEEEKQGGKGEVWGCGAGGGRAGGEVWGWGPGCRLKGGAG